jgi:ABC-type phosphate/phosphonate transport system substrate-binding protein
MFNKNNILRSILGALLVTAVSPQASLAGVNDIIFSTAPTQSPELTLQNYQPLAEYLSRVTGKHVLVKPAKNFQEYSANMRNGTYDMLFDGPHFISYRLLKKNHILIAKLPGELRFAIVARKDANIKKLHDLIGKRVCSPSLPHLGTLTFLDLFPNPVRQPEMQPVQSFKEALACIKNGTAQAAVFRDKFWNKKVKDKSKFKVVHVTKHKLPERGITISSKVDKTTREKITKALTTPEAAIYLEKAFSTIGGKSKFIHADKNDYENLDELLKVVWGFHLI